MRKKPRFRTKKIKPDFLIRSTTGAFFEQWKIEAERGQPDDKATHVHSEGKAHKCQLPAESEAIDRFRSAHSASKDEEAAKS